MRIAIWHNLPSGGGFRALYDQVRGLIGRGHRVEIWCPESAERAFLPIDDLATVHRRPLANAYHFVNRHRRLRDAWRWRRQVRAALQALEDHVAGSADEIDRGGFDVVLGTSSQLFYMHPLARFTRTPSVIYLHEIYRRLHEARPALPWEALPDREAGTGWARQAHRVAANLLDVQADRLVLREERRAAREWDAILCNSHFSREGIVRAYGIDARVCYLGIDLARFSSADADAGSYLVGLGGLDPLKCVHLVVDALALVPASIRPPLRWIGNYADPSYLRSCEALARRRGVTFSFEVRVSEDVLRERLQGALALAYPPMLEPFGYAPLEANACGTPVIAIAEGGIRETVADGVNGILLADRRPETWAAAIARMATQPELRQRLARQGEARVRELWSPEAATARLERELENASRRGRRQAPAPSVLEVG
jgi:glycosyltransferase involved in cell wall biosynthesis